MPDHNDNWIGGDDGPLVVLQAGALPHWRGAADFQQSLMNGGSLETDYAVICDCGDHHLHCHGRDMLQIAAAQPQRSFTITVEDERLRLLVGADSANGDDYGYSEVVIAPGPKQCDVYRFDNVIAIIITPV